MKKLFAAFLGIAMCLALTACGALSQIINQFTDETTTVDGDNGTQQGGAITTTKGGNSQSDRMKSQEEAIALIGNKYLVDVKIVTSSRGEGGEVSNEVHYYAASDGTYYYVGVGEAQGNLFKALGDGFISYSFDNEIGKYRELTNYRSVPNPFTAVAILFLVQEDLEYTSKSSVTFLGRACTKYEYLYSGASIGASASQTEEWIIDNETGVCFKHSIDITGSVVGQGSAYASGTYEVTQFELNNSKVDAFIKEQTDKVVVSEWDTEMFSYAGLSENGTYKFTLSDILDSSVIEKLEIVDATKDLDDNDVFCYDVNYYLYLSQSEGEAISNKLVQNFYGLGAKYNSDYELKPIDSSDDSLYFVEKEDGVMTYSFFTGYINNSNFHVGIDLEWNPYINNGLWRVHLIVNSD